MQSLQDSQETMRWQLDNSSAILNPQNANDFTRRPKDGEQAQLTSSRTLAVNIGDSGSSSLNFSSRDLGARNRLPIFPDFLLPGNFDRNLATFKAQANEATATRGFYPLMPLYIIRRLIEIYFTDAMAEHQFITLASFMTLLEAQYAASAVGPAEDATRWALVNAILALAIRFKTAVGSESDIAPVTDSLYKNATMVVHQLILQEPNLPSIQALLAMAIFSRGLPDVQAFIMLTTNASRQLEIFGRKRFMGNSTSPVCEEDQFEQAYEVSNRLSEEASRSI
ncbi:hypothetical protein E0Z10_g5839 [Xylaria hypoxylon]|uniref:Transcription factor domain-containing protein n=1 Tax=Xylaria hypoxylon TaxID=37992 RepID=A0A4Z0YUT2_9PEZI|nr:hypothetical protein E0Z10_g5839 [Xylaria hypoxylon]